MPLSCHYANGMATLDDRFWPDCALALRGLIAQRPATDGARLSAGLGGG